MRHSLLARRLLRKIAAPIAAFRADRQGIAAVEFAILVPLLLTFYLGSVEVQQAIAVKRKLVLVASTLSDLTSQFQGVTANDLKDIFAASKAVLAPFDSTPLNTTISSVKLEANNRAVVVWSAKSETEVGHAPGSTITLPPNLLTTVGQTVIMAEASYTYDPALKYVLSTITLSDTAYMTPRQSAEVKRLSP